MLHGTMYAEPIHVHNKTQKQHLGNYVVDNHSPPYHTIPLNHKMKKIDTIQEKSIISNPFNFLANNAQHIETNQPRDKPSKQKTQASIPKMNEQISI